MQNSGAKARTRDKLRVTYYYNFYAVVIIFSVIILRRIKEAPLCNDRLLSA